MAENKLLEYGIAINFFGNYARQGGVIDQVTNKMQNSFLSLQNLFIGGSITYAFASMTNALIHTALELEHVYTKLMTVFNDPARVVEHFAHAREFVAQNPFMNLEQVHEATAQLAMQGLAKTHQQASDNLQGIGDFMAGKGLQLDEAIQAVIGASNGNWEMLRNRGVSKQTLGSLANESLGTYVDNEGATRTRTSGMKEQIAIMKKSTQGTKEYSGALIKYLGIMESGGMERASQTITGSMGIIGNAFTILKLEIVGASQITGTLSNSVANVLSRVANIFRENIHAIERIGAGVGNFISDIFDMFIPNIDGAANMIAKYINKIDLFFKNYQKNLGPIVLFLYLVKLQVSDFLSGFYEGFRSTFDWFVLAAGAVWKTIIKIADSLGITEVDVESLGKSFGILFGIIGGVSVFKTLVSPITALLPSTDTMIDVAKGFDKIIMKGRVFAGLSRISEGNWTSGTTLIKGGFANMGKGISAATKGAWAFTTAALSNPYVWIAVAIVALGALIYYWEDIQEQLAGVSDITLLIIAGFLPIVGIPLLIAKHWTTISLRVKGFWIDIKYYFRMASDYIKGAMTTISNYIEGLLRKIFGDEFVDRWKLRLVKAITYIGGLFTDFMTWVSGGNLTPEEEKEKQRLENRTEEQIYQETVLTRGSDEDKKEYWEDYHKKAAEARKKALEEEAKTKDVKNNSYKSDNPNMGPERNVAKELLMTGTTINIMGVQSPADFAKQMSEQMQRQGKKVK